MPLMEAGTVLAAAAGLLSPLPSNKSYVRRGGDVYDDDGDQDNPTAWDDYVF